ncbi:hypothetical protein OIB37_23585 [Streptomyces sp. NBC_00820]|uniref:DUF6542 domain-containing protein n=1 Tax=Streptomyces sp. NBC_00820 TaxID=2975842 RepID=UPI002ED5F74C|nr:hypothetical protein OIB37_23585 [Streptomyces sp. NBC_00820]
MEQPRTRPPNDGPRRGGPRSAHLPPQARRGPADVHRPVPEAEQAARRVRDGRPPAPPVPPGPRLPGPRLTGLGAGLFCAAAMALSGFLDDLLFGASLTVYGVLFLPVCVLTALWVRGNDLLTAPVSLPIAFAVGLFPVADGRAGLLGRLMGLVTGLATQAGWLYGGTLIAAVIVLVRRVRWVRSRRRRD